MTGNAVKNARNIYSRVAKPRRNSMNDMDRKERKDLEEQMEFFKGELKRLDALVRNASTPPDVSSIRRLIENNMDEISDKLKMRGGRRVTMRKRSKGARSMRR